MLNIHTDTLPDTPQLSRSVQSVAGNDEAVDLTPFSVPHHPPIIRQNSAIGRNGSVSPTDFTKTSMFISKDKPPLPAPSSSQQELCKPAPALSPSFQRHIFATPEFSSPPKSIEPREPAALGAQKNHASRSTHTIKHVDTAIDSNSEDNVDEGAIDDDDSSDWEDSPEDHSVDEKFFKRVDSTANLTSPRSLITLALQNDPSQSASALHARSKTGSPNGSDEAPLMMKGPIRGVPSSDAQAAPTDTNGPAAHSPRTNRRTMLATELTNSLRRDMIWERKQKSRTANAVKRRHTSTDLINLQQHQDKACMENQDDNDAKRWNEYFEMDDGYHSKGW